VYTAHYDAYGIDPRGTVFPGATDNALGVGKLFAAAAIFAKGSVRPRRSIIFIASTGEEYGDIGIAYWLEHPTCLLANVAADINFDGSITELWGPPGFIINYSFGQSDMGPLVRDVAARNGLEVVPDPVPDESYFERGDHWAFVQKGIPALYLVGGPLDSTIVERAARWTSTTYHMPSDSLRSDWNWDGPAGVARLGFEIGERLAEQNAMPQWRPASKYNRPRGTSRRDERF
jgi:Zn-dependent M28 family amino/carboxypeptidase